MIDITDEMKARYPRLIPADFWFECGPGWKQILDDFFSTAERELPEGASLGLRQVKEKLGGLRVYYHLDENVPAAVADTISEARDRAEARSYKICEVCGKRGRFSRRDGFLTVVCEEHQLNASGKRAIPQEPEVDEIRRSGNGWERYDFDSDAFVPTDPPEDWE